MQQQQNFRKFDKRAHQDQRMNYFQGRDRGEWIESLPNEMKVGIRGELRNYVGEALQILRSGYSHLSIMGRGQAVPMVQRLVEVLRNKNNGWGFKITVNDALNKRGVIVEEVHVMVSQGQAMRGRPMQGYQRDQPYPRRRDFQENGGVGFGDYYKGTSTPRVFYSKGGQYSSFHSVGNNSIQGHPNVQ